MPRERLNFSPKGRYDLGQVFVPIEDSVKAKDCDVGTPDGPDGMSWVSWDVMVMGSPKSWCYAPSHGLITWMSI